MSDERYTVVLGDRRYAIHRKWARLPAGDSFGFLSDLSVDSEGRVHVVEGDIASPPQRFLGMFDTVITNPPYAADGTQAPNAFRAAANHESDVDLTAWIAGCRAPPSTSTAITARRSSLSLCTMCTTISNWRPSIASSDGR